MQSDSRGAALVTGASSGIGREIACLLAADGHDLLLVARSGRKLQELGRDLEAAFRIRTRVLSHDLTDPVSPGRVFAETQAIGWVPQILVNNAGFGLYGPFARTDLAEELALIHVNVTAVVSLTKLFLAGMIERGGGCILNVASTAAFQPGPRMAVYYASKAFVLSFSEAIAEELAGSGVTVTALCPGPTQTQFQTQVGMGQTRLFSGPLVMDAPSVARAGYEGMKRGRRLVIPGVTNKLLANGTRLLPRRAVTRVAAWIQETRSDPSR
jgi:hypothetical protein